MKLRNNKWHTTVTSILFVSLLVVAQACSKSNPSAPVLPTDQDASGLYTKNGTSTATFNLVDVTLLDIKGMVYGALPNQKFIFFDVASNVLIDGVITAISLRNVTGTAVVYRDGNVVNNSVNVTGTVDSRSNVSLIFTGAGVFTSATVSGLFSTEYDTAAANVRIVSSPSVSNSVWDPANIQMVFPNTIFNPFLINLDNSYSSSSTATGVNCNHRNGIVDVAATVNIYQMSEDIQDGLGGGCSILVATNYSGFATVIDVTNSKDTMWYAMTNGTYSHFAILKR